MAEPTLVTPAPRYAASYIDALGEGFRRGTEPPMTPERIAAIAADATGFLARLLDQNRTVTLPDGTVVKSVPFSMHWLVEGDTFIGEAWFRHVLNERLLQSGGNIGYGIRPSYEGKGYGKSMLRLTLDEGRKRGLARVLLTTHEWNVASQRVIEANGGVLENVVEDINGGGLLRRYWIAL
ncbi:MAG: GNAT family N-acetyltransferase [Alphaproteobacteria bacterium]|nr:GNAT family N-acetyltransferase [Alphaproteobacteria bacterium]